MTSMDSNFNFLCGRPHGAGPPPLVHMHPPEPDPLPPLCGRHKWMAPYQKTATGRGCSHQTRLMFSCLEPRLKWAIRPFRSLVHVLGTVFLKLFGKPKPFLLSKNS